MTASAQLAKWVAEQHAGQLVRNTNKPYFNHLETVATLAGPVTRLGYEIGLCHDLLEDTNTNGDDLQNALIRFGYAKSDASEIMNCVIELTDVYTKKAYPYLHKVKRKKLEAERLFKVSAAAQTVKYADLMDNIDWMMQHDQKHATKYLNKKRLLIANLNQGNAQLRQQVLNLINKCLLTLKYNH
ncbi:hypothetical protein ASE74_02070 [Pedobacter sp. Leaf216]|uniref:hypothetical protein n=1 Tax=Pedobacter sp. Leaf216 TaxID=1735684 RepID=UPI0006F924E4|nr:hypothetical protein [Pedobacter sp. Leaf216]KQM74789.1 hypothetical protein ASE74_02070 [Pedobacter sp. Leaf216]